MDNLNEKEKRSILIKTIISIVLLIVVMIIGILM